MTVLLLLALACTVPDPCGGAPAAAPDLAGWAEVPVGEGVVCRADAGSLVVDYPGKHIEAQIDAWAASLERDGWHVVELVEPEDGVMDSRWSRGEANLSLTVRYQRTTRSTAVYASRY